MDFVKKNQKKKKYNVSPKNEKKAWSSRASTTGLDLEKKKNRVNEIIFDCETFRRSIGNMFKPPRRSFATFQRLRRFLSNSARDFALPCVFVRNFDPIRV